MLNKKDILRYREDGYVIPDFRLPAETIEQIKQDHDRLLERHPEFRDYCPTLLAHDTGFLRYARAPEIVGMVNQLIGPDFALWNSSFFAKLALTGSKTPWHQDGEYWPIRLPATCTVWIAVDASTPENGCLRVIPGSHRTKELMPHEMNRDPGLALHQELPATALDEASAVDLVLEPGQVSLHDVFLYHGSEANRSENPRRGMTMRFMPLTSVFGRELAARQDTEGRGKGHGMRTLYLMGGADQTGRNDFLVRQ